MKRASFLRRRTAIRARRAEPRRSSRIVDLAYVAWVRTRSCAITTGGCYGPIHAHHAGRRHGEAKADDTSCIALCQSHHQQWHAVNGAFAGWQRDEREAFADLTIAATRADYARWQQSSAATY